MYLPPGTRLGPYEILSPIEAGGMGSVYRGRDTRLVRDVAIKVLPVGLLEDDRRLKRFLREARAAAALSHPSIVAVYDVGEGTAEVRTPLGLEPVTLRFLVDHLGLDPRRRGDPEGQAPVAMVVVVERHEGLLLADEERR